MPFFTDLGKHLLLAFTDPRGLWGRRSSTQACYHITWLENNGRRQALPSTNPTGVVQVTTKPGKVKLVFLLNGQHLPPGPIHLFTNVLMHQVKILYSESTRQLPIGLLTPSRLKLDIVDTDQSVLGLKASAQSKAG
jgi:hypothetical protein